MTSIAAQRLPYSEIRAMFDAAKKLESQGRKIIHLEIGRPDFNTPQHIVDAAIAALQAGKHHYTVNAGIIELRQAIADKYISEFNLNYRPESEIIVTNGVAQAVFLVIHALLNPGDQVLIPDPRWVNYEPDAITNYSEPVSYSLVEENGFQPDPEEIEDKITPRTRMLILASPSNPTGGVTEEAILTKIADIACRNDLMVVSDEIYEKITYPPTRHICPAALDGMYDRTLVLNGFSKFYSMTGWRLGYTLGPKKFLDPILRFHQYMITSTNTFAQWGAVTALKGDQQPAYAMRDEFQRRRDYIHKAVHEIPGVSCALPAGAFYLFPSVKETGLNGREMANLLLEKAGVATVAGECFGRRGAGHIRLSYANSIENLKLAAEKITDVIINL